MAEQLVQAGVQSTDHGSAKLLDLGTVWRRKWYLAAALAATLGLASAYLGHTKPIYEAEARLLVENRHPLPQEHPERPDPKFLDTQVEVIRSPVTLRRALDRVHYTVPGDPQADSLSYLLRTLRVSPVVGTDVLKLGVRAGTPEQSVDLVHAIVASYKVHLKECEHRQNLEAIRRLNLRERDVLARLEAAQQKYREFRETSPLLGTGKDALLVQLGGLRHLGDMAHTVKNRRMDLESKLRVFASSGSPGTHPVGGLGPLAMTTFKGPNRFASVTGGSAIPGPLNAELDGFAELDGLDPLGLHLADAAHTQPGATPQADQRVAAQELANVQTELRQAEARLSELSTRYGDKYPEIVGLRSRIGLLKERIRKMQNASAAAIIQEVRALTLTENNLTALYEKEMQEAKSQDVYAVQEQQMCARIQRLEELHDSIIAQRTQTQAAEEALAQGSASTRVAVLEEPQLSENPVWPKPIPFLAVCSIVTLVGGSVLLSLWPTARRAQA